MRTKQHNLNPVERTISVSGLLGLIGREDLASRAYPGEVSGKLPDNGFGFMADPTHPHQPDDRCVWLGMGLAAGNPGSLGIAVEGPELSILS